MNKGLRKLSIGKKLILGMVVTSGLITLIITSIQLYGFYKDGLNDIDRTLDEIKLLHIPQIAEKLWISDIESIRTQIRHLIKLDDLQSISLFEKGNMLLSDGNVDSNKIIVNSFNIDYKYKNELVELGRIDVFVSHSRLNNELVEKIFSTLAINTLKTFIVGAIILFLFSSMVTRHLEKISKYFKQYKLSSLESNVLVLDRQCVENGNDELDVVVHAINNMNNNLLEALRENENQTAILEQEIYERKKIEQAVIKAKEEAEQANHAKSEFLSSMSHELRTPLNAILGFSQLIEMNTKEEKTRGSCQEIINAGNHLLSLINEVLDLSKIEDGNIELSIEKCSLNKTLNNMLTLISPLAEKNSILIENKVSTPFNINVDEMRFKQVLLNILSNAIKYNSENGKVIIDCSSNDKNMLCLSIADTGKGLTHEQQISIFEPFNRAGAENSNIEGTGLGLKISKDLIELMGGTITVKSTVGKGSSFLIQVPIS